MEKKLMKAIEKIAVEKYGGHYTIFSFTTNYKASFGTVTERDEINNLKGFKNLSDCLIDLILSEVCN